MQSSKTKDAVPSQTAPSTYTTQQVRTEWNQIAWAYNQIDYCMQSFYFRLIHMMRLQEAHHILEVACGTGKLLQLAVNLKQKDCTYLASDLCPNMVGLAKQNLSSWIQKLGINQNFEEWLVDKNLVFSVQNGEQKIESAFKFDRIICNLVLHLTENAQKMLQNLYESADNGCLLGLTILAHPGDNGLLSLGEQIEKEWNLPSSRKRSLFHLENKIGELAKKTGWEVVVEWEQNTSIGDYEITQSLKSFAKGLIGADQKIFEEVVKRVEQTYKQKKVLNFLTQMAILRKK